MGFIYSFISKLKEFFIRKREDSDKVSVSFDDNDLLVEKLGELDEEEVVSEISDLELTKELLEHINVGDIVWGKRYKTLEEKELIPVGHQCGPYLVLGKCSEGLICSTGSSMEPILKYRDKYVLVNAFDSVLVKDTYFKNFEFSVIDSLRYEYKLGSLSDNDLNLVMLNVKRNGKVYCNFEGEKYKLDLFLQSSDIINYKGRVYVVLDVLEDKILCVPYEFKIKNIKKEDIDKIDYSNLVYFDKNIEYKYLKTMKNNTFIYLLNNQKKYLEQLEKAKTPQRGSIIEFNDELYYIYGELGQEWQTFKIFKDYCDECDEVCILNTKFYTDYENVNVGKKDEFDIIGLASDNDMENIKDSKKTFKVLKKNTIQNNKKVKKKIEIGNVIEHKYYKNERFIIINKCDNQIYCISMNKLLNGVIETMIFYRKDVRLSKNGSTRGIVWLDNNFDFDLERINEKLDIIVNTQLEYLKDKPLTKKLVNNS